MRRVPFRLASCGVAGLLAVASAMATRDAAAVARELAGEANQLLREGLFEEAEGVYRDALAHDASMGSAHYGLARVLAARRDHEWALAEAEVAASFSNTGPEALPTLASLREAAGDLPGAIEALERYGAQATAGQHPELRVQRARSQLALLREAGSGPLRILEGAPSITVPIDIVQDKVLFKASINGRVPVDVVLDTGADHAVLTDKTLQRAGLRQVGGGGAAAGPTMTLVDRIDIGGLTVRRVPALVRPEGLRVLPNRGGEALSPLSLGLSAVVDYASRTLTLARRLPGGASEVELPLQLPGLPLVTATMTGVNVSLLVDTGSEATSIAHQRLTRMPAASDARRIPMRVFDAWGRQQLDAYLLTPGIDLELGGIVLARYPVIVRSWPDVESVHDLEIGGILGHNFLRRYRVTFDLTRRVLGLARTS